MRQFVRANADPGPSCAPGIPSVGQIVFISPAWHQRPALLYVGGSLGVTEDLRWQSKHRQALAARSGGGGTV